MKVSKDIWEENEEIIRVIVPKWYWVFWGFFVVPVGLYLNLLCRLELVGGSFITPLWLKNVKTVNKDGSRSITFYDNHTIL